MRGHEATNSVAANWFAEGDVTSLEDSELPLHA